MRNLNGQVLVLTGASSGIGAATAVACARAGMDLVLSGRDAERLAAVATAVKAAGRAAEVVPGNVTDAGLSARLLDTAERRFGQFDVVFANAGYGFKRPMHETSTAELREIFEVNFFAATELIQLAARRLLAARGGSKRAVGDQHAGHLLMCSSALAKFTMKDFGAYSATKAAQHHVCRAMRMELRAFGIEVSSVHPITTRTEFFIRAAEHVGETVDREHAFDHVPSWLVQRPEQVAEAVVRCLHRPVPEVWTALVPRLAAAVMDVFPRFMDVVGRKTP